MSSWRIPFNRPHLTHREMSYILDAHARGALAGDGSYTRDCHEWIEQRLGVRKCLLTHSCTGALEMMAILADLAPGDEVVMPSFTFVSTANAFVLRGAVPVFVDIRPDTLNIDPARVEEAVNERTRAIVPVHYAGVGCEMDRLLEIARPGGLLVLEDAAQGLLSRYRGRCLGSIGQMGALSFHETKNVTSGEGGALLINAPAFVERAEIIREKGTDRSRFFRGEVDRYSWVDIGSSYLPGELVAAFLKAQLEQADRITSRRIEIWNRYHRLLEPLEAAGRLVRPSIPEECAPNGHMYQIQVESLALRERLLRHLRERGILAVFHYVPLHSSAAGRRYGRAAGTLDVTERVADRLVRLPLFGDLTDEEVELVASEIARFYG